MKKLCSLFLAFAMILGLFPAYALAEEGTPPDTDQSPKAVEEFAAVAPWNLLDATTASYEDSFKRTISSNGSHAGLYGEVTQRNGYANVSRDDDQSITLPTGGGYTWFTTKNALDFPDEGVFTIEASVRLGGARSGKANELSARVNGKGLYAMFLKYGAEGGISTKTDYSDMVEVDTTVWHNYGLVVDPNAKTYDIYVDGVLLFDSIAGTSLTGADLFRIGADSNARCDMDIQSVRIGSGDLSSNLSEYSGEDYPDDGRLVMAQLSADTQNNAENVDLTVTVHSQGYTSATEVTVKLLDNAFVPVDSVSVTQNLSGNGQTAVTLTIPKGIQAGTYFIQAETADSDIFSVPYSVTLDLQRPDFPQFAALGYSIDMTDYRYNPTEEFNFPTIVDTKAHPVTNAFGVDSYRYYLYYAPHDAPAGNCVAVSNSLDGPWVEYENNPVISKTWPKNDGSGENYYDVSHVSSPQVVWIAEQNCYVMYFHGDNSITRYATSTDLLNWTYGGVCVTASDFSTTNAPVHQASYAKVFEHAVPGLGNKYIMLMMVTCNLSSGYHSNIGWAHSTDGTNWTAVKTPLVNPDINPAIYGSNFSGPWFMELEGRYFVICHATSGEIYAFEVGERLDQCIEWGEVYSSQGVRGTDDANPECYPDYGRSGAPSFLQDDTGRWHMFYEAGKRLNTNTIHAVEVKAGEENDLARAGLELEDTIIKAGETTQPVIHLFDKSNRQVAADTQGLTYTYHVDDSAVLSYVDGTLIALAAGTSTAWVTATLNEKTAVSSKVTVTVTAAEEAWDLLDADTSDYTASFAESKKVGTLEQKAGYVNILKGNDKSNTATGNAFIWMTTKSNFSLPSTGAYTVEATIRLADSVNGDRTNEFSARTGGMLHHLFLRYGKEGAISAFADFSTSYKLDTTVWHSYGMVVRPDHSYTIYVDGQEVLTHTSTWPMSGTPLIRVGADNKGRCDMDVQSIRVGTGDLSASLGQYPLPEDTDPRLTSVELSASSQKEDEEKTITVTVTGENFEENAPVAVKLVGSDGTAVQDVAADGTLTSNSAAVSLTISSGLTVGTYYVEAEAEGGKIRSSAYTIETSKEAPTFPTFASVGYTIDMEDYKYNPTQEFNFPTIVDTQAHPVNNSFGNNAYRYYLFYAPHDNPAGNCVAASNSLDGPWVEYEGNPVVGKVWTKDDGSGNHYSVSHVSSPHVMWNEELEKYIMYFHGENPTTRYATSDDLLTWTYGGVCVNANDFSNTGSGFSEASYARVYEHAVPGLGNKYIMTMMITGSGNGMQRNIYWAHSTDGITWTPVKTPLLTPSDPIFKNNFSGANFMEWNGRYFVICHSSNGDMHIFEVGESLDESIYWGDLYASRGSKDVSGDDDNHLNYPDYARAGAPSFMQDDTGRWHMFYEGGRRLHANIVHAVEVKAGEENQLARAHLEIEKDTLIVGDNQPATLLVWDKSDQPVQLNTAGLTFTYHTSDPAVLRYADGQLAALAKGTATAWVTATLDGMTATSSKVAVTVKEATVRPQEVIITNAETPNKTALNLELPAIFKAQGVLDAPIDNYYLYFSYTDEVKGAKSIALATAPAPEGPWTVHNNGTPVITKANMNLAADVPGPNAPWPVWDSANKKMLMYFSVGGNSIRRASSTDGITFTYEQEVLTHAAVGVGSNAYQQSVYEYTIPGKSNKYTMLLTGNGAKNETTQNGKQIFYAWSNDGLSWTVEKTPLFAPVEGDKGNLASPRLLMRGDEMLLVCHSSAGDLISVPLNPNFSKNGVPTVLYNSVDGAPDNARAADAAFLEVDGNTYFYYTASSNKAKTAEEASVLVCRKLVEEGEVLFQDDFSDGNADGWTPGTGTWAVADGKYVQSDTAGGSLSFAGDMTWRDYEFEAKVTPVSLKGSKLGIMLSGRADGAANRYIGSYNTGKLTINRRVNTTNDTVLAQKAYTMAVGTTYTIKMTFQGDEIALYVNGVKELEATDATLTAGKIGFATYETNATFDDVMVRALKSVPQPAEPLELNQFGDHQVIQRNPETENAVVTMSGKLNDGLTGTVQVRIVPFDGGNAVVDWTAMTVSPADATWSGTLTVPQGGWYKAEARLLDSESVTVATAESTSKWGVGINILCIGQSNMVGQGKDKPYTVADDLVANYRSGAWKHLADPYDGAGGSLVPAMANALVAELGIPVGIVPAGYSGSGLHAPNKNSNHGPKVYWMYYEKTDPDYASTLYGRAVTRAKAAGGVELSVWNQGETDGSLMIAESVYESDMKLLLQRLRTDLGNAALPMFICQIGTHNPNISNDAAYSAIRNAQHDLDDGKNFFLAATEMEFARQDTAHYKTAGMNEIGKRVGNSMLYYYGKSTYYRGPYIASADYVDGNRSVVDVTITHRGGNDISPASNIPGFEVLDNLTKATITSAVRQSATTIRLTLSAPISGSGSVRYLYGLNPFPDTVVAEDSTTSDLQQDAVVVKDNTPLALPLESTTLDILIGDDAPLAWNLFDHAMYPDWKTGDWRTNSKTGTFTQEADYLNITKPNESSLGSRDLYHWAISPATLALPRNGFTLQVRARTAGDVEAAANEIGVRMGLNKDDPNGKLASFFLGHGTDGFVSASTTGTGRYTMALDTTVWHDYTLVARLENDAYVFDLYVDNTLAFEGAPFVTYKGGDLIRMGADNGGRCDLDVQTVRLGTGEVLPDGVSPARITNVALSAQSQKENEAKTVTVTVTGRDFEDGAQVALSLVDRNDNAVPGVAAQAEFTANTATATITIPAGLSATGYFVKAQANSRVRYSDAYKVEPNRTAPVFPTFTPQGYTIEMEDYKYNPTQEFNFPTIVDTKEHPVENSMGNYRYYIFYAPHDAPAGNCVAASNSLDGPWVEYEGNPVVGKTWPKDDESGENWYDVSHVSSPQVIWNDVYNCYFMYFHGENPTTRYATSTDLINWTYGGVCVDANDFSPTGSGFNEASYAKVFEHEVPGLGNKYIMLLMITGTGTGGHRNIYWAHSEDGKTWTAVQTSLLDPMMDAEYKGNFSGPWFMEREGRYYVICHASSGNMYAFEVGERLNECIPWGVFYNSVDSADPNNPDHDGAWPDYGRAGAPSLIKSDDGRWHMFYEGGKRLHANIVHATAPAPYVPPAYSDNTTSKTETLPDGTKVTTKTNKTTGAVTVTTLSPGGTKTVAVTQKDGSLTETLARTDGVKAEAAVTAQGAATATVTVPEKAGTVVVDLPAGSGNVALLVQPDGSVKAITMAVVANGRARVMLTGSAQIRFEQREVSFSDTEGTSYAEAVYALAALDVFRGTGNESFSPTLMTDRATLVTLLHRIDGSGKTEQPAGFVDVPADVWYADSVSWAANAGITKGVGGGSFAPDAVLTWEQVAVMLYRCAEVKDDREGVTEAERALGWCTGRNIGAGLNRANPVNRGELATMLYDYIKALVG